MTKKRISRYRGRKIRQSCGEKKGLQSLHKAGLRKVRKKGKIGARDRAVKRKQRCGGFLRRRRPRTLEREHRKQRGRGFSGLVRQEVI